MTVAENAVVSLNYKLSVKEQGQTEEVFVEQTEAGQPFVFLFGFNNVLPLFEKNLNAKGAGDTFDFHIDAVNGYGIHDEQMIINIPTNSFIGENGKIEEGLLTVGNFLPMRDSDGNTMEGLIKYVGLENVTMDFNHPLAGKELHFVGEVVDVRAASIEELEHGHVHGPGGHHHH